MHVSKVPVTEASPNVVSTHTRKPLLLLSKWANREYSRLIWLSVTKDMKEHVHSQNVTVHTLSKGATTK